MADEPTPEQIEEALARRREALDTLEGTIADLESQRDIAQAAGDEKTGDRLLRSLDKLREQRRRIEQGERPA